MCPGREGGLPTGSECGARLRAIQRAGLGLQSFGQVEGRLFIIHQGIKGKIGRFWGIAMDHLDKMKR